MADKAVSELIAAERIGPGDMFVLEQDGTAKKLTGQVLLNWLFNAVDGHGGIKSIAKIKTVGLVDTYRITLADSTTFDFTVTNGEKGDVGVFTSDGEKTNLDMDGYKVRNLGTPTENGDAVNLAHMNAAVQKARPRNLLDNSDFRNPVNQRGLTSYTATSTYGLYCIDRWRTYHADDIVTVNNGYIAVSNRLYQVIPAEKIDTSKTYTAVAMKTDGTLLINVVRGITTAQSGTPTLYLNNQNTTFRLIVDGGNFIWAALYEGEYTRETLPEYQPKGYGAELAECQRYYQIRSTNGISAVDMRPMMRLTSPTIMAVADGYSYSAEL